MLHKLLIALFMTLALTACGSDNDTPSSTLPPDNNDNSADEDDNNSDDDDTSDDWLNLNFEEETDTEIWEAVCVSGSCSATLAHDADEEALSVTPEWTDSGDELEVTTTIDPEIEDLTGGNVYLTLHAPAEYANAAGQVVLIDNADQKGYIGYVELEEGENPFSLEDLQLENFGFTDDDFSLSGISQVGLQILANDDDDLVGAETTLLIDDVILSPGDDDAGDDDSTDDDSGSYDERFTFDDDEEGWSSDGSAASSVSHDADEGALVITPDWSEDDEAGNRPKAMGVTDSMVSEATIEMVVTVTQAQVDGGLQLQPYIQQNSDSYTMETQDGFIDDLEAGDNNVSFQAKELEDAHRVGVQLIGPLDSGEDDDVLIKEVNITLP